jgi:proteasome lid subunit RPN8/RPN11
MVQHAFEENPNECCGLLAGVQGDVLRHYRITNTERSPYRYSMDSKELLVAMREIDDNGWEIQAFYHSHTHSPAYPSETDRRLAANWPDPFYLLISLAEQDDKGVLALNEPPVMRLFKIADGTVVEEPIIA